MAERSGIEYSCIILLNIIYDTNSNCTENDTKIQKPVNIWIFRQVINCYMRLLMENFGHKVYIMSTFFYTKLCATGFEGVQRWLKKVMAWYMCMCV